MKNKLILSLLMAGAMALFIGADNYDGVNPKTVAKDNGSAHWDTTWTTATSSDDTLTFGFAAKSVTVCTPAGVTVAVQVLGNATTLRNPILGTANNPRAGLARVSSTLYTLAASSCRTFSNSDGLFYGVRIKATGTDGAGTIIDVDS